MNKELEKYIRNTQRILEVQFQNIRDTCSDSDTKGGKNEQLFGLLFESVRYSTILVHCNNQLRIFKKVKLEVYSFGLMEGWLSQAFVKS
jgi:hypothetical protein